MTKIFCQCLRSLKLACFVCKIPPLIFISIIAGGIYFLCSYLRVLLTIFNIALWHETNFQKNVYFRHLQTETMGYKAMQYSTNTAWGSSENFVLIIQERLPGVVKWDSSGKKNKKERVRSLLCTVRFDLASDGGSYSVQVQGVTDVCYLFIEYVLLTNGILVSLLE